MPLLTVVITYIDTDKHLAENAAASVAAQSIKCECIMVHDVDRRGPQWARNEGLRQCTTPFITWLDADDLLEPTFAEQCLRVYRPNHYVYTDFHRAGRHHELPGEQPCGKGGNFGVVTRVVRTDTARAVGGFNEGIHRLEDTEFWLRIRFHSICGVQIAQPLIQYTAGGARSTRHKDRERLMREIEELYERYDMACCGKKGSIKAQNRTVKNEGDGLYTPTWLGNKRIIGRITGRDYGRASRGHLLWMAPADVNAMPGQFMEAEERPEPIIEQPLQAQTVAQDYDDWTVEALRELAENIGVKVRKNASRDTIIDALTAYDEDEIHG